ncbi:hypothetical protein Tco_1322941, partial [Tanacetum coccineum]
VVSSGWSFVSAILGDNSSIPIGGSISPEGFVGKYKLEGQSIAKLKVKVLPVQYEKVKVLPLI